MITKKSYARVTLALDIIKKLKNGYHEVNTIKQKIDLFDEISIEESDKMQIICSNKSVPLDNENLVWKITAEVKKRFSIEKNVSITIDKKLPLQGGLAGASSNAATTLEILNDLWKLNLTVGDKSDIGKKIGMDVPFFFFGSTVFDRETTDLRTNIEPSLAETDLVVVMSQFGVSTKEAYSLVRYDSIGSDKTKTDQLITAIRLGDLNAVSQNLHNDFERFVFEHKPELKHLKQRLLDLGSLGSVMSGSGSTVFGIAESSNQADEMAKKLQEEGLTAVACKTLK